MNHAHLRLLFWELTARCNLSCRHCRADAHHAPAPGELSIEEILTVATRLRMAADPLIVLTGGEPLMRPDFFSVADACCRLFSRVALATNGTLVDEALAERIVETGIQRVSISIDGARAETHDAVRGVHGCFDAAWRGFRLLKGAGASLQVNMTLTRHNAQELPALLARAQENGADAFHVFMLVPVGCGAEMGDDVRLAPQQGEDALAWLFAQSVTLHGRMQIKATCAPHYARIAREQARRLEITPPSGTEVISGCLAGTAVCFLSRTGDVQPCGYFPVRAGNVREQSLSDIWQDAPLFKALRDTARLTGKCGACGCRVLCRGCRARALAVSGDHFAAEPDCLYQPPEWVTQRHVEDAACLMAVNR